jgi:hypothetical protein
MIILVSPKLAYSLTEKTYDQALIAANKEIRNIGYHPEGMMMEYGSQNVVDKFRRKGAISYNALYSKEWHPFHFCQNDGVSETCVWVLISKTDDDSILW